MGEEIARRRDPVVRRDPAAGIVVVNDAQAGSQGVELDSAQAIWLALVALPAAVGRLPTPLEAEKARRSAGEVADGMEADMRAARDGYNPNR